MERVLFMNKKGSFLTDHLGGIILAFALLVLLLVLIGLLRGNIDELAKKFLDIIRL